jgi:hypothetical protein
VGFLQPDTSSFNAGLCQPTRLRRKDPGSKLKRVINLSTKSREAHNAVIAGAAERYGFRREQVSLRLYVGKLAGKNGSDENLIRSWCATQHVGAGPIELIGLKKLVEQVCETATSRTYINNPVIVSMKVLAAAGRLDLKRPIASLDTVTLDDDESSEEE